MRHSYQDSPLTPSQPVSLAASQPVRQPDYLQAILTSSQPTVPKTVHQLGKHPINQPTSKPVHQPVNQSASQLASQKVCQPASQPASQPKSLLASQLPERIPVWILQEFPESLKMFFCFPSLYIRVWREPTSETRLGKICITVYVSPW